jgi:hypothetical protein
MQPPDSELRDLIDRLHDAGGLTKTELARLEERLEDDAAMAYYLAVAQQEAALAAALEARPASLAPPVAPGKILRFPWRPLAWAAAAAAVFFCGVQFGTKQGAKSPVARGPGDAVVPAVVPARLTGLMGVEWETGGAPDLVTTAGAIPRLAIRTGLAELTYGNGVRVTIEGPADFSITGPMTGRLLAGRVVASSPHGVEGFTIDYQGGKVVDLGTEFGLETGVGGRVELGVFDGKVELHRPGTDPLALLENQAVLLDEGADEPVVSIPFDRGKFVRRIPARDFRWEVTAAAPLRVEFDVSHLVWKAGIYRALFKWMQGQDAVLVRDVELYRDGVLVTRSPVSGATGVIIQVHDNLFELAVPAAAFERGRWSVRATLQSKPRGVAMANSRVPIQSVGVLQFEEGLVNRAQPSDFIGTWTYHYGGVKYDRRIFPDGTIRLYREGKLEPHSLAASTWSVESGVLHVVIPEINGIEDHVLRDAKTMIFVNRPYENAKKVAE